MPFGTGFAPWESRRRELSNGAKIVSTGVGTRFAPLERGRRELSNGAKIVSNGVVTRKIRVPKDGEGLQGGPIFRKTGS